MVRVGGLGAVALAALLLVGAAFGPAATTTKLPGGGTTILRPLSGAPVAAIELWFRAPSIGFETAPKPGIANMAALTVAASAPLTGTPLATLVAEVGGRFSVNVYPQTIEISALVPATEAARVLRTMSGVYFTPVLSDDGRAQAISEVRTDTRLRDITQPSETLREALFEVLFKSGPDHYSPVDGSGITSLTLDELRAFATRAFRASNATIVLTGDVDQDLAQSAVSGRTDTSTPEPAADFTAIVASSPESVTRNGPVPGFGFAWTGPPIKDERAATALDFVADYLFDPDSGVVSRQLDDLDATIDAQYVTYFDPGVFYVEATGGQATAARAKIETALASMRKPLDQQTFEAARRAFAYHVMSDVATPLALADNFGWYAAEGNAAYAPGADLDAGRYIASIHALTPEIVAETVSKYLTAQPPATAVLEVHAK
jgi:predicted Zn-dependent peptidase